MENRRGTTFPKRLSLTLLVAVAGCLGGGSNQLLGVTISPAAATVTAGDAGVTFTAALSGVSGAISWSVEGDGSVSPLSGAATLYTPPTQVAATTSVLVVATAGSFEGVADVTVNPAVPALLVNPPTVTVVADGGAVEFTATLVDTTGIPVWILTGPGTLSSSVGATTSFTPPASVAATTISYLTAELGAGSVTGVALITIEPP
ncbi:MAG: hypothetical protein ACLPJH_06465 [Myxococcaceae bacterium]